MRQARSPLLPTIALAATAWLAATTSAAAATPTFRALSEMREAVTSRQRVLCEVDLTATVCAADSTSGLLALQDASGAEVLAVHALTRPFHAGERIRLRATRCELIRHSGSIALSAAPVVDNGGIHSASELSGTVKLEAGLHPIRVFYFNAVDPSVLEISYSGPGLEKRLIPTSALFRGSVDGSTNVVGHGLDYSCYDDTPSTLDDVRLQQPTVSGMATNFDISLRRPLDYVAMQFRGMLQIPTAGEYTFTVKCDDAGELYIGSFMPGIEVLSSNSLPPPQALPPTSPAGGAAGVWSKVEGLATFIGQDRDGARIEMKDGNRSITVCIPSELPLPRSQSEGVRIRATGVCHWLQGMGETAQAAVVSVVGQENISILAPSLDSEQSATNAPLLTTAAQVQQLSAREAARKHPVHVRGVITCTIEWGGAVIQDSTRGVFFSFPASYRDGLQAGDFVEIRGTTAVGDFAPTISAESVRVLGRGQMPPPVRPSWNQLISGSLDAQFADVRGIITEVESNRVTLLTDGGKIKVQVHNTGEDALRKLLNTLVRIRGCLLAEWDSQTRQVRVGEVRFRSPSIQVEQLPMADLFAAPEKTISDLLLFDLNASGFERVKLAGHVIHVRNGEVFLMQENRGLRFRLGNEAPFQPGDLVEVVGIPDLSGPSPRLHEPVARKTGSAPLPPPAPWSSVEHSTKVPDATRVEAEARLIGMHQAGSEWVLELQTGLRTIQARINSAASPADSFPLNGLLRVTGVYSAISNERSGDLAGFELLLNSLSDAEVIQRPPWWTLRRLLFIVASLLTVLGAAAIWIGQLRRQVAHRTKLLEREHERRERAERERALEVERSRIARDLHDDLGSSLTEIRVLASSGMREPGIDARTPLLFQTITEKARSLVGALDVIVWAVNPEANSLQSLADYLSSYVADYLEASNITCRFKIPVTLPEKIVDGQIRHDVFLAVKETLHNIVRHASATEVEFQLEADAHEIRISIFDNGQGFDAAKSATEGHGLRNLPERLAGRGGQCRVQSTPGAGTRVSISVPIPPEATSRKT